MTPAPSSPLVVWTVAARRQLGQSLARPVACSGPQEFLRILGGLMQRLQQMFPGAGVVIVQEQYLGYRPRASEFILLVEIDDPARPGRHVVKLGPPERLQRELDAWNSVRPHGLRHDLVLLNLEARSHEGQLIGLVYDDAQQFLGGLTSCSLEEAFLAAVAYGSPSPASVADVFAQLYERLGLLLYSTCFVDTPTNPDFLLDLPRLAASLAAWRERPEVAQARQEVHVWAANGPGEFRDPVDYLEYVCAYIPWQGPEPHRPPRQAGDPAATDLVPSLLRGRAHGDLHGRNVRVGRVRDRVRWPVVFDYEHMSHRNLLAWDFVKMETELKIRAYPLLFSPEPTRTFVQAVQAFELELWQETERLDRANRWPEVAETTSPGDRLRQLLLALRKQASLHLGSDRGRASEWLDEYRFALGCYGVQVGRFPNLERPHLLGAFVSAGVAVARFLLLRAGSA
jgi:hypothetical protein